MAPPLLATRMTLCPLDAEIALMQLPAEIPAAICSRYITSRPDVLLPVAMMVRALPVVVNLAPSEGAVVTTRRPNWPLIVPPE